MSATSQAELRLQYLNDERETVTKMHETVLAAVANNEDKSPSESQQQQIVAYREREIELDKEIGDLTDDIERNKTAIENSKAVRRVLAGGSPGVDETGDGIAYRSMAAFARDVILTRDTPMSHRIRASVNDQQEVDRARERLQLARRVSNDTLSSDVQGLQPEQHIAQIFQIVDTSRPIVASARRATLERGSLTYPEVVSGPEVDVQEAEKTEGGDQKMQIDMKTATATVYLGGGDLSWQAVNWSTPSALDEWFALAAADYALKTERDAANVITGDAFTNSILSPLGATPGFDDFMTAVGAGGSEVYSNSSRMANTVYMAPDVWWYLFGTTSDAQAVFTTVSANGAGPLTFIPSRGLNAGTAIVGDSGGLLVAETGGAPVELQVVEPAIGGYEVGIIGAFEAVVVDPGAFALITTAS